MQSSPNPINGSGRLPIAQKIALSLAAVMVAKKVFLSTQSSRKLELRHKVILITGGSRGLGFAMAQEFGRQGARLALCARDEAELNETRQKLSEEKIETVTFVHDIANSQEAVALIRQVIEHFGRIDVLVNNAGIIKVAPVGSLDHAEYERAMNLMFWAPVNLSLAVLPHMQATGSGHIVNIASVGGRVSIPHLLPYSCAKFALVGFSTGLSSEIKSKGIHVLTVVPGLMRTGSYLNAEFAGDPEHEFAWFGILGNLPGFSVAADYAASQIRKALEQHKYNCTIGLPAKILIALETLLPEISRTILESVDELLPSGQSHASGSGSTLEVNFGKFFQMLTGLGRKAAANFNE